MFPIELKGRGPLHASVKTKRERERERERERDSSPLRAELMNKISSAEPLEGAKSRNCEAIPDWGNDKTEG